MIFKSPPNRILSKGTQRAVAISTAVSPEQGIITSFALLLLSFELSIFVLLLISLIISDLYLVYNSPYKIHSSPSLDTCSFDIPIPFDRVAISSNRSTFHSPVNSGNLRFGTLRFFDSFISNFRKSKQNCSSLAQSKIYQLFFSNYKKS